MIGEEEENRQEDTGEAEYWAYVEEMKAQEEHNQYVYVLSLGE
jgi:hypothetical protein